MTTANYMSNYYFILDLNADNENPFNVPEHSETETNLQVTHKGILKVLDMSNNWENVPCTFSLEGDSYDHGYDNSLFYIQGNRLKSNTRFNYENRSVFSVRVKATDANGGYKTEIFLINIQNNPIDDSLTICTITETDTNTMFPSVMGLAVQLVSGVGSEDNSKFNVSNGFLTPLVKFDSQTRSWYNIRCSFQVNVSGGGLEVVERAIQVFIKPDLSIDRGIDGVHPIMDNCHAGVIVGSLEAYDRRNSQHNADTSPRNVYRYSLVEVGNYNLFEVDAVSNNLLKTKSTVLNRAHSANGKIWLRVRAESLGYSDETVLSFERDFLIDILDIPLQNDSLVISEASQIAGRAEGVSGVRAVSSVEINSYLDENGQQVFYRDSITNAILNKFGRMEFISINDSGPVQDNQYFQIENGFIKTSQVFDYEPKPVYELYVKVYDVFNQYRNQVFVISVTDMPDTVQLNPANLPMTSNGTAVATISVNPMLIKIVIRDSNGTERPLPSGSVIKNTATGQKFVKIAGDEFNFIPIEVAPLATWSWSPTVDKVWQILQGL
jgi:hypothetical protein